VIKRELFVGIREFVVAASRLLNSYLEKGEKIPYTIVEKYKVEGPGSWSMTYDEQLLTVDLIVRHEKDLSNLPEFRTCSRLMQTDPQVSKHLDKLVGIEWGSKFRRTIWDFLRYFLSPIFEKYLKESKFDQQLLEKLYSEFEDFIINDQIPMRDYVYLENFDSDVDRIDVEKGLVIRKITNEELERLLQSSRWAPSAFFHRVPPKYVLETTYTRRKTIGKDRGQRPTDSAGRLYRLVTALRLFKPGAVGFNAISTSPESPFLWGHTRSGPAMMTFLGQKYFFHKTELTQFKDFWVGLSKSYALKSRRLEIAIRRFENAYQKTNLEDKLIDFMIAFEALFFKRGESGEFRHKLGVRVSKLLGNSYEERKRIAEEINKFYGKRSNIVHGEKITLPPRFTDEVESYLRDSMKQFMERLLVEKHDEIISHLDFD